MQPLPSSDGSGHHEHDRCQELPKYKPSENEDVMQFTEVPLMFEGQDFVKVSLLLDEQVNTVLSKEEEEP
ncbi:hypothetical protein H920_16554 [Fukomys damarensis]|uniref:Uncharacterized protein n=1 Tax=Fukomys damarensis TaxID=885580 RepID=A0A091CW86_FUKDA|nr:hypothetical protein H920_16554 [Fukomys damarensis]